MNIKRGGIYWANIKPRSGSEQSGRRPIVVVSHDSFNSVKNWNSLIVVPLSTSLKKGPTTIFLSEDKKRFSQKSIIICHQITTLDRSKIEEYIGELKEDEMKLLEEGLKNALSLL